MRAVQLLGGIGQVLARVKSSERSSRSIASTAGLANALHAEADGDPHDLHPSRGQTDGYLQPGEMHFAISRYRQKAFAN